MNKIKIKRYYYHHAESGSLWWSRFDFDKQPNDGLVEPVSYDTAIKFAKEYEMVINPEGDKEH